MKDKNVAAILAFFVGWLGIHRFYLGQIGLGIVYVVFMPLGFLLSMIDFVAFLAMDKEVFNVKYNRNIPNADYRRYNTDYDRRQQDYRRERDRKRRAYESRRRTREQTKTRRQPTKARRTIQNPFKQSGIKKYKDFDYEGAIEDFNKALTVESKDVSTHFNLSCAYSLTEQKEKSFFHLSKAIEYGFVDFDKIKTHDALAYLRIQEEFDTFVENGYRMLPLTPLSPSQKEDSNILSNNGQDLLDQLKQLGELKEKGLLTEEEFTKQKKKLLG